MKSVGEVMAIGRTFPEALLKGWRALETGSDLLPGAAASEQLEELQLTLREPHPDRLRGLFRALAAGETPQQLSRLTGIDPWFLDQMRRITDIDRLLTDTGWEDARVLEAKRLGISDRHLGFRLGMPEPDVRARRLEAGIRPVMKAVDTCGAEFQAETPYF